MKKVTGDKSSASDDENSPAADSTPTPQSSLDPSSIPFRIAIPDLNELKASPAIPTGESVGTWKSISTDNVKFGNGSASGKYIFIFDDHGRYFFPPETENEFSRSVLYDFESGTWSKVQPIPAQLKDREDLCVAASMTGDHFFLFGGSEFSNIQTTYPDEMVVFDPKTKTFDVRKPSGTSPGGRQSPSCFVSDSGNFVVAGGTAGSAKTVESVGVFNPVTNAWNVIDMTDPVLEFNKILAVGHQGFLASIWIKNEDKTKRSGMAFFSLAESSWKKLAVINPGGYSAFAWSGNQFITSGCGYETSLPLGLQNKCHLLMYSPAQDEWTVFDTPLPPASMIVPDRKVQEFPVLYMHAAASVLGSLLVLWGGEYSFSEIPFSKGGAVLDLQKLTWTTLSESPIAARTFGWYHGEDILGSTNNSMILWGGTGKSKAEGGAILSIP